MRLRQGVPVLPRPDGGVQVGWTRPVVVAHASAEVETLLATLAVGGTIGADDRRRHGALLQRLSEGGLLEAAPPTPVRVRVHHTGTFAVAIAAAAARMDATVGFAPDHAPLPDGTTASWHAIRALRAAHPRARLLPAEGPSDIDVLVACVSAPPLATALLARDQPHVAVLTDDGGVTVSHVITPGVTPCSTCAALHAADADPAWVDLAPVIGAHPPRVEPRVASTAAALAAHACIHGGAVAWRISDDGTMSSSTPRPHSACRCGASGPVGDVLGARRARMPRG
ncbi:hypothetical protein [Demequina sp. NBRC 110055]|uniref:hypothetical protein n=1 Tax=Demequina sp. NBRC 110055 TaxID=1570344 RepID=UPI001184B960|nr:hypothetical protein [Demequina sp. NBRC 110055]